jgi:hypothetical protein
MADPATLSTSPISRTTPPSGYRGAQTVKNIANTLPKNITPDQEKALGQLNQSLSAEKPPRTDVPRGFYLNIVV